MNRRLLLALSVIASVLLSTMAVLWKPDAVASPDPDAGRPDITSLTPLAPNPDVTLNQVESGYLSPVTVAPRPFTHMLLRWEAVLPTDTGFTLSIRVSADGNEWSEWGSVNPNPELWQPEDGEGVFWSEELYAGEDMRFWQVRAEAIGAAEAQPTLGKIDVHTVDARFGAAQPVASVEPTELMQRNAERVAVPKPAVVTRTAWGNPEGQGSRAKPVYYPVKHMVLHHTADANSLGRTERSWADRVRAIWAFHTYTRGWGDIGYNYLIDPNGVIYEGRAGGDDAVGFHDTANYGSMGVATIGTYSQAAITANATNSLVSLMAWKANQKGIDPLGRGFYYGCSISKYCAPFNAGAVVDTIAGHRQVTPGHTTCPGDRLMSMLPEIRVRIRDAVAAGGPRPDNGDLVIDEVERSFSPSAATWYTAACGYGGSTIYTYTTDSPAESTNWGTWTPNLPSDGYYRVFAHIPQGCNLGTPPYASSQATYLIRHAAGESRVSIDHNSATEWADLGVYRFNTGNAGSVGLADLTGEPYAQRKVLFFDSVRWEAVEGPQVRLNGVRFARTTIAAGELLEIGFTVQNTSTLSADTQDPQAGTNPDGSFNLGNSYAYDEGECFLGDSAQSYPAFPKAVGRFRVTLGYVGEGRTINCAGGSGGYPWRWGLNGSLAAGETRVITGYVRFREPGTFTLQAGLVEEYARYHAEAVAPTTITVLPEQLAPAAVAYDATLRPLARVYRLGSIPDNLLTRTRNAQSVVKGEYLGSFVWDGQRQDWGEGGPVVSKAIQTSNGTISQTEQFNEAFLIEQTRVFVAPRDGLYTFRTISDDGSWLWVDGTPVVVNAGMHDPREVTGQIQLRAGRHVLAFKYFERTGGAAAAYDVQMPETCGFGPLIDGLSGIGARNDLRRGAHLAQVSGLTLAADDLGGNGVVGFRYSWDGNNWFESSGALLNIGRLVSGDYILRYQARDAAGNLSAVEELRFRVDPTIFDQQLHLPLIVGGAGACQ